MPFFVNQPSEFIAKISHFFDRIRRADYNSLNGNEPNEQLNYHETN